MTAVFALLAPLVATFYGQPDLAPLTRVAALSFALTSFGIVPRVMFQRKMEVKRLALVDFSANFVSSIVGSALALAGAGVWAIVGMTLAGNVTNSGLAFIRSGWRPKSFFRFAAARPLIRMSLHLLFFNILNYWARSLDNLLVGKRLGEAQLGYYTRAYSLMLLPLSQVTGVISAGVLPAMAQASGDKPRVLRGYLDAIRMIAFVVFPTMVGLTLVADPFIRVVYGEKWAATIPVLRVLGVVGILQSFTNPTGWIYVTQGRTDRMARWGLGACPAILAALAIGASFGSTLAVAYAYLIVNIILTPIGIAYSGALIGLTPLMLLGRIFPTILTTAGMAVVVIALGQVGFVAARPGTHLAIATAAGIVSYVTLNYAFKTPALIEIRNLLASRLARRAR
jgi:PST family polysaccharide transporter